MERKRTLNYQTQSGKQVRLGLSSRLPEVKAVMESLKSEQTAAEKNRKLLPIVLDVARGMHTEQDKLCKKNPIQPVTALALSSINDIIIDALEVAGTDVYVKKIKPFVAAGDNPETRDVVMVLTQIIHGLMRVMRDQKEEREKLDAKLKEPILLHNIIESLLESDVELGMESVPYGSDFPGWFLDDLVEGVDEDGDYDEDYFPDYKRLSQTDLTNYFKSDE